MSSPVDYEMVAAAASTAERGRPDATSSVDDEVAKAATAMMRGAPAVRDQGKIIKKLRRKKAKMSSPVDDVTGAAASTAERGRPDAASSQGDSSTAEVIMRGAPAVRDQKGDYRNNAAPFIKNPVAWIVEKYNDKKLLLVPADNISNIKCYKNCKWFYENGIGIRNLLEFQKQHVVSGSIRKELNCFGQGSKVLDIINPDWPVMIGFWIFKQDEYYFGYSVVVKDIVPEKIWWSSKIGDTHCDLYAADPSQTPLQHLKDINLNKVKNIFKHMKDCECGGNYPNDTASLHVVCNFPEEKKGISEVFSYLENIITETHGDDMDMSAQVDLTDDDMDATKNLTDDMNKEACEVLTEFYSHDTIYNGKLLDKEVMCDHHAIISGTELSDTTLCYRTKIKPEIQKALGLEGHYDCNKYIVGWSNGGCSLRFIMLEEGKYKKITWGRKMLGNILTVEEIKKVCNDWARVDNITVQLHNGLKQKHITTVDGKVLSSHPINKPYLKGIKSKYVSWSKMSNITKISGVDGEPVPSRTLKKLVNLLPAKMESSSTPTLAKLVSLDINTSCEKHSKYVESNKTPSDGVGGDETGDELEEDRSEDESEDESGDSYGEDGSYDEHEDDRSEDGYVEETGDERAAAGDDTGDSAGEAEDEKDIPERNVTPETERAAWTNIHGNRIWSECPLCWRMITCHKGDRRYSCEYDHIHSVHEWGVDNPEDRDGVKNIMPICKTCNRQKGKKHMMEYVREYWPNCAKEFKEKWGEKVNLEY